MTNDGQKSLYQRPTDVTSKRVTKQEVQTSKQKSMIEIIAKRILFPVGATSAPLIAASFLL